MASLRAGSPKGDKEASGGGLADGDEGALAVYEDDGARAGLDGVDGDCVADFHAAFLEEAERLFALIERLGESADGSDGAGIEGDEIALGDASFCGRDGVAVGIEDGATEVSVERFEDEGRDGVFEPFGFVVDDGPIEFECFDEEGFDEAVPSEDVECGAFTSGGEGDSAEALVACEPGVGESFDHGGGGAGGDADGGGDARHGGFAGGRFPGEGVDGLDVVLDGLAGHFGRLPAGAGRFRR